MEMRKKIALITLISALCAAFYYVIHNRMSQSQNVMIQKTFKISKSLYSIPENFEYAFDTNTGTNKKCKVNSDCDSNLYCSKKNYSDKNAVGECHRKEPAGYKCHDSRACSSNICSNEMCS